MVEEMMAAVVAGVVEAAVFDSVDISSKGDYSFERFSFSFRSRSLQKQVISRLAIVGFRELQEIIGRNTTQEGIQKRTERKLQMEIETTNCRT